MSPLSILFLALLLPYPIDSFRKQSIGAKGRLLCGNKPMVGTTVELIEEDSGLEIDDMMAEGQTDKDGNFHLNGSSVELTNVEPRLKISHRCNNKWICKRKVSFTIPNKYINHGKKIRRWFDLGTLNMETIFDSENRNCIPFGK